MLINLFYELLEWTGIRLPIYQHLTVKDWPNSFSSKIVYLQGGNGNEWLAGFICPCGCREFIELVLVQGAYPSWRILKGKKMRITILPSISLSSGCKSHFFIINGKVIWCV